MTWDKTKPDGAAALNAGDNAIRNNFAHLEDSLAREHQFPDTYGSSSGRHTLPVVASQALMTGIGGQVDGMLVGRTDLTTIFQRQAGTFVALKGYLYATNAIRLAFPTANLPTGFLWLESDTLRLFVWTGSAWVNTTGIKSFTSRVDASDNEQAMSTDFSAPDLLTGMDVTITEPNDGDAYEINVEAVIPCRATSAHYLRFTLEENIDGAGDVERHDALFYGASMDGRGMPTMLRYTNTSPTAGKTHQYRVYGATSNTGSAYPNPTETIPDGVGSKTFFAWMTASIRKRQT